MNHPFSQAPIYAPIYPPNHSQSAPSSRPQSHVAHQHHLPTTHTIQPPLTSENHTASAFGNSAYPTQPQSRPASLSTALRENNYAPTANAFYNGQGASFPHVSPTHHLNQQSSPSSVNGLPQPVYGSAPPHGRNLLPMPPRGNGKPSLSLGVDIFKEEDTMEEPQPTHVVGSQGRRGILPSAAGKPPAVAGANTSGQKAAPTPPKDAEGKYPCPHCTKNYLHAKHLKRHLLRHTGVRPYTCGLCTDTFSRSDILKRHFMKCSVRRGNPSGENHLSHSRAKKKSRQEDAARLESNTPTEVNQAQQMEVFPPTSPEESFDINALNLGQPQYVESANNISRSNEIKKSKRATGSHSNRASLGLVNTSGYEPTNYGFTSGHVTPDSATTSGAATPYNPFYDPRASQISPNGGYNAVNGRDMGFSGVSRAPTTSHYTNGTLPHIAGQRGGHDMDWNFANFGSNDDYGNAPYHSGANTPIHPVVKAEGNLLPIDDYYPQLKA